MMPFKWDLRFLSMAKLVSTWSKDPSTKVGAVIVRPDRSIVSVGFNGFPRNMEDNPDWYINREEKYSRIVHAEVNALIQAKADVAGCTLYTYPFMCCDRCIVQMLQAGINRFVFPTAQPDVQERWGKAFEKVKQILNETNVAYCEYFWGAIE